MSLLFLRLPIPPLLLLILTLTLPPRPQKLTASAVSTAKVQHHVTTAPSPGSANADVGSHAWRPQPGKFLLAHCISGRLSNQVFCMRSALATAQLLNRSLLVPTWGLAMQGHSLAYEFPWSVPVSWRRMQRCLTADYGPDAVLTVDEYLERRAESRLNVTLFASLDRDRERAWGREEVVKAYLRLNEQITLPQREETPLLPLLPKNSTRRDLALLVRRLDAHDVVCMGEVMGPPVPYGSLLSPPLGASVDKRQCGNLWHPHSAIMEFVNGFGSSVLGGSYAAIHFRRGDFYEYLSFKFLKRGMERSANWGYPSALEAAENVRARLSALGIPSLYVATNARKLELDTFARAVQVPVTQELSVRMVVDLASVVEERQAWLVQQKWAQSFLSLSASLHQHPGTMGLMLSIVDKFICARADRFFPSKSSTFSMEIKDFLRRDEGLPLED